MTKEKHVLPEDIDGVGFNSVWDDTVLYTTGAGPCILMVFYRIGHVGLAHFNPDPRTALGAIEEVVKPRMKKEGRGKTYFFIGCMNEVMRRMEPDETAEYVFDVAKAAGAEPCPDTALLFRFIKNIGVVKRLEVQLVHDHRLRLKIEYMHLEPYEVEFDIGDTYKGDTDKGDRDRPPIPYWLEF